MCNTLGWDDLWNPKLSPLGSQEPLCWAQPDLKPHCLDNLQLVIPVTLESENPSHDPHPGPSFATSSEFNKSILSSNSKIFFFLFFNILNYFLDQGSPTSKISCLMIWGGADIKIIGIKSTMNVKCLNHPETIPPDISSWENCFPWNWHLVPEVGDCCSRPQGAVTTQVFQGWSENTGTGT